MKKIITRVLMALLVVFVAIQFVPVDRTNPEARLTEAEKEELIAGLQATFAADPPVER